MVQAQVEWAEEALEQLAGIYWYIRRFHPVAAARLVERLEAAGESLATFPSRGRPGHHGTRELPTIRPYVLVYEVHDARVVILSIRHGRQRPPED